MMKSIIQLLRPCQWLKNVFVFLPLFFGGHLLDSTYSVNAFMMFVAFCLADSGIYCFNDICDAEDDKLPVSKTWGYAMMTLCFTLSLGLLFLFHLKNGKGANVSLCMIVFYILMNIIYCIKLKHIVLIDCLIVAIGYVLRVLGGGLSTGILLSHWIVLLTFLLALFLTFAKRRDENLVLWDQLIAVVASLTMVCYILYTVSPEIMDRYQSSNLYITSLFVLIGIIRYLQLMIVDKITGSPMDVLLRDRMIQMCVVGWSLTFWVLLYC